MIGGADSAPSVVPVTCKGGAGFLGTVIRNFQYPVTKAEWLFTPGSMLDWNRALLSLGGCNVRPLFWGLSPRIHGRALLASHPGARFPGGT